MGQGPSVSRNSSSVWFGCWKCAGCGRAAEDCPPSEPFQKCCLCSTGNWFAMPKSSKLCMGAGGRGWIWHNFLTDMEWNCWVVFLVARGVVLQARFLDHIALRCRDSALLVELGFSAWIKSQVLKCYQFTWTYCSSNSGVNSLFPCPRLTSAYQPSTVLQTALALGDPWNSLLLSWMQN